MTSILAILAAFFSTLFSTPSPATPSVHTMFSAQDNGGVLVTRQPLTAGQVIYSGGRAYRVVMVHGTDPEQIMLVPGLPASDRGKTVTFST